MYKNNQGRIAPNQLIIQALSAAEASIGLAKQLLAPQGGTALPGRERSQRWEKPAPPSTRDLPGIVGKFDGENMVVSDGKSYPVPTNYAGKSKLVFGDTLKRIENADGTHLFKQIEKVERVKVEGKLAKKGGQWIVKTTAGEYKTLNSNISFLGGQEGDAVTVLLPKADAQAPWAAIDEIPVRDAERRARRTNSVEPPLPASEKKEEAKPGLVGKLLEKVTARAEKPEKEIKKTRRPAKAAKKEEEAKAEEKEAVPPPPAEDDEELR